MDESTAWLYQAGADWEAAERFAADEVGTGRCHAIAKWQQTVEKAIKALVSVLHDAGILSVSFRTRHQVEPYVGVLVRLPRGKGNRTIQQLLHRLLDQKARADIKALDNLAPQLPPRRNTEYPFQDAQQQWTYPAAASVFSDDEVRRFRKLARDILDGTHQIMITVRRRPK